MLSPNSHHMGGLSLWCETGQGWKICGQDQSARPRHLLVTRNHISLASTTHPKFISLRKPFRKSYFWSKFWRLRFRREVVANTKLLRCNFVSLCYFWSNNESRDSVDCSCGCLEGSSIFLETFIHLRVLILVCGEGEVVGVMAWLAPFSVSVFVFSQLFKPSYEPLNCFLCCLEGLGSSCLCLRRRRSVTVRFHCAQGSAPYPLICSTLCNAPGSSRKPICKVMTVSWGSF